MDDIDENFLSSCMGGGMGLPFSGWGVQPTPAVTRAAASMASGIQPQNLDLALQSQQQQLSWWDISSDLMRHRLAALSTATQASQDGTAGIIAQASQCSPCYGGCVAVPDPSAWGQKPQQAQQWPLVDSHTSMAYAMQPAWMQHEGLTPWQFAEASGSVAPWAAQMQGSMTENMVNGPGYIAMDTRTNFWQHARPSDLMLHDDQAMQQVAMRQAKMAQCMTPEHVEHMEARSAAQVRMHSAQIAARTLPTAQLVPTTAPAVPITAPTASPLASLVAEVSTAEIGVGTGSVTGGPSTLRPSRCLAIKVKTLLDERPRHGHERDLSKVEPLHKQEPHHGDANNLGQDIASAVANFLANPEGEMELDDKSGESSDEGQDQPDQDSGSCDESFSQAEHVTGHIGSEEHIDACLAPVPEASTKGKVEKRSHQSSSSSSRSSMLQNHLPELRKNGIHCLERGKNLCRKLLMLSLPASIKAHQLPGLCNSITNCIVALYKEKRKPSVVAVQQRLREQNLDEVIVQSLLPICARMQDLYQIWLQEDCQACVLLCNQPLCAANLESPSDVEAQCTPQFLEALAEVINEKLQPSRSIIIAPRVATTLPARVLTTAVGNTVGATTPASNTSSTWPVPVVPPGLFHAAGSPPNMVADPAPAFLSDALSGPNCFASQLSQAPVGHESDHVNCKNSVVHDTGLAPSVVPKFVGGPPGLHSWVSRQAAEPACVDAEVDGGYEQRSGKSRGGTTVEAANSPFAAAPALVQQLKANKVTTLMLRNLPHTVTQKRLIEELTSSGFAGVYDFCYMPSTFHTGIGKGYAFVNFTSAEAIDAFVTAWHGSRRFGTASMEAALNVSAAAVQGREENVKKWDAPRMRRVRNPALRPLVMGGDSGAQVCSGSDDAF